LRKAEQRRRQLEKADKHRLHETEIEPVTKDVDGSAKSVCSLFEPAKP
jgi:hypothetical protein